MTKVISIKTAQDRSVPHSDISHVLHDLTDIISIIETHLKQEPNEQQNTDRRR